MRRYFSALVAVLALAACAPAAALPTQSTGPTQSGTATCQPAPVVPDDVPGWNAVGTATALTPKLIGPAVASCGENRFLFSFLDAQDRPAAAPNRSARAAFFDLGRDRDKPFATVDGTFIWAIKDVSGIYALNVVFPEAGRFGVEITTALDNGTPSTFRVTFDVHATSPLVRVGDKAPSTKTPTLADVGGDARKISTDIKPDPALYQTSIDNALANHKPLVVVFATPKFCISASCGPTLDTIKPYVTKYPTVTFVNVEPYKLKLVDGTLEADLDAKGELQETATSEAWKLVIEPHVYVVNRDGIVTADFELIFSDAELASALDAVK
ncbi:MAG TPA: lipoprotein [Candidatus Limnocylindrales bacterium]|nr:lipoprotein [Candidatus Limnocylindrales bacterium]